MSASVASQHDLEVFEPRQSLWKLIEELVAENERREIKEVLGHGLVDETSDLHREVDMLLEIWQEYRDNNDKKNKEILQGSKLQRLPEPPEMRSNLKKEIELFIKALKQRSSVNDTSIDSLSLSKREESIVEYALAETNTDLRRPSTATSSCNGRITPCRPTSVSSGSRSSSSFSDVVESFPDHINVETLDHLAERLRNVLLDEKDSLMEDVAFLQNCLFEESQFGDQKQTEPEPSLQELKELGIKLEKEMTRKGDLSPVIRKPNPSSPPRRVQRPRRIVRSCSTPCSVVSHTEQTTIRDETARAQSAAVVSQLPAGSLSPSPPTSAVSRKPGSVSRFRKVVIDSRVSQS